MLTAKRGLQQTLPLLFCLSLFSFANAQRSFTPEPVALKSWQGLDGQSYTLTPQSSNKATVFFFHSAQCPIANIYTPRMVELAKEYASKGVQFFLVDANKEDTPAILRRYASSRSITFPVVKDDDLSLANALHATHTPQAILLDSRGVVRYRGRFDDNQDRAKVVRHHLKDALVSVLAGEPVKIGRTLPVGCEIFRESAKTTPIATTVTYSEQIAPLLNKHCVNCHRPGETGPFSLETYAQARTWGKAMRDYTARRQMPPWKAVPGHGEFQDARVMTDTEIGTIAKWVEIGMPAGDLKKTPPLPARPTSGFHLGKPDQVIHAEAPYRLGAEGQDVYRNFVVPVDTNTDRFIRGFEFQADNRAVVHHIIVFFDLSGKSVARDNADPEPGYSSNDLAIGVPFDKTVWVAGWAPGNSPRLLPKGTAFWLPKNAKVVLQVHYHKNGQEQYDRSRVGLYFEEESNVKKVVQTGEVTYPFLNLKPGVANQVVKFHRTLPEETEIIAVMPHMHMLGRKMKLTAKTPEGAEIPLISIQDWDFNWQETYVYKKPIVLPSKTKIHLMAEFDNSEANPRQPSHPPVLVRWGEATTDEMCIGFFQYTSAYIKGQTTIHTLTN